MRILRWLVESAVLLVAIGLPVQPAIAAAPACSSGVLDAAAIQRVDSLGWNLLHFSAAEANSKAFLLSPVGAWVTYATLFNADPGGSMDELNAYNSLLGYSSIEGARQNTASDISAMRHVVSDDHVEIAQHLIVDRSSLTVARSSPSLESPCVEISNRPIEAWTSDHTHSLISSSIGDPAGGFPSAYGSQAMYLLGKPDTGNAAEQTLGSETVTTVEGGQAIGQPLAQYSHYSSNEGIQGVAEPIAGSRVTMYLFSAPDRSSMLEFEDGLNQTTWPATIEKFQPAQGAVAAQLDLRSLVYLRDYGIKGQFVDSLGGTVMYLAQEGRAVIDDTGIKFAVVSNFQVDNPDCCTDAMPTTLPEDPFFVNAIAPVLIIVQDRSGLVLFTAGS